MRLHEMGPRNDLLDAPARRSPWSRDYGTRSLVELDRPYIDDEPAHRHGWDTGSRWGRRPPPAFERPFERVGTTAKGFLKLAWARVRNVAPDAD